METCKMFKYTLLFGCYILFFQRIEFRQTQLAAVIAHSFLTEAAKHSAMSKELRCANDHMRVIISSIKTLAVGRSRTLNTDAAAGQPKTETHSHMFKLPRLVWASDQHKYEPTSPSKVLCQMKNPI